MIDLSATQDTNLNVPDSLGNLARACFKTKLTGGF